MHLRMAGDDPLDQRGAGSRLADHENRSRVVVGAAITREPLGGEGFPESAEHLDFRLFAVVDDAAPRRSTPAEGLERLLPFLQVLKFLAEAIVEKRECPWIALIVLRKLLQAVDVRTVFGLAHIGKQPVGVGIFRLQAECPVQHRRRLIRGTEKHVGVRLVHQKRHMLGRPAHGLGNPARRLLLIAEQAVHRADEIEDDRVAVVVLNGFLQGCIRPRRLPGEHEQPRQVGPGGAMCRLELGDRSEGLDGGAVLPHFNGNQADQKMGLHEIGLGAQQPPAAGRCIIGPAGREMAESRLQRVPHPGFRRRRRRSP